jgi:hypothetical protein
MMARFTGFAPGAWVRFFLFRDVENYPTLVENAAMMFTFCSIGLLQWFFVFLSGWSCCGCL